MCKLHEVPLTLTSQGEDELGASGAASPRPGPEDVPGFSALSSLSSSPSDSSKSQSGTHSGVELSESIPLFSTYSAFVTVS